MHGHRHRERHGHADPHGTLLQLGPGQSGIITGLACRGPILRRMLDMGIRTGIRITMIKTAPLNDPIQYAVNGTDITLRRDEARFVHVQPS